MNKMLRSLIVATFLVGGLSSQASADRIKTMSKRLQKANSSKVRLSAALGLAKSDDPRAIRALSFSLSNDSSESIRKISASTLGEKLAIVPSGKIRKEAIKALRSAAKSDKSEKVRTSAQIALGKLGNSNSQEAGKRGLWVGVKGPVKTSTKLSSKTKAMLLEGVRQTLKSKKSKRLRIMKGSKLPTGAQLKKSKKQGYVVVPQVTALKLLKKGSAARVQCSVQFRISLWAGKTESWQANNTATVSGSGQIQSQSDKASIQRSSNDCIMAVAEQVTRNQVLPFLLKKSR